MSTTAVSFIASLRSTEAAKSLAIFVFLVSKTTKNSCCWGGVVDARIAVTCSLLHFRMPIEDRTPLTVVPHPVTDIIMPMASSVCLRFCLNSSNRPSK